MNTHPGFTADATLYQTTQTYRGVALGRTPGGLSPAIPPCRNCDYICDLCARRHVACGACGLCEIGWCDPSPPGGSVQPPGGPFQPPF